VTERRAGRRKTFGGSSARKTGGRSVGTKNRATIEKQLLAERITNEARMSGQPLGKEVLEKWMIIFDAKATELMNQPVPVEQQASGQVKQVEEFVKERDALVVKYGMLAVHCAQLISPYQSPTLKATFVQHDYRNRDAENEEARAKFSRIVDGLAATLPSPEIPEAAEDSGRGPAQQPIARLVVPRKG
jgi:hypothetical protein